MKKELPKPLSNNEIGSRKVAGDRFNDVMAVLASYEDCERCGCLVSEKKMGTDTITDQRLCLRCRIDRLGKSWEDDSVEPPKVDPS